MRYTHLFFLFLTYLVGLFIPAFLAYHYFFYQPLDQKKLVIWRGHIKSWSIADQFDLNSRYYRHYPRKMLNIMTQERFEAFIVLPEYLKDTSLFNLEQFNREVKPGEEIFLAVEEKDIKHNPWQIVVRSVSTSHKEFLSLKNAIRHDKASHRFYSTQFFWYIGGELLIIGVLYGLHRKRET